MFVMAIFSELHGVNSTPHTNGVPILWTQMEGYVQHAPSYPLILLSFYLNDFIPPEHLGWGLVWDVVWSSSRLCPHHSRCHSLFPPVPGVWQGAHCETVP